MSKTKTLKLLFVNFSIPWGGGEFWHFQHAMELSQKGYDVVMLTNLRSQLSKRVAASDIKAHSIKINNRSFTNPVKRFKVSQVIRREKPDVIILNGSNELKLAGNASRQIGISKIIYRRGNAERVKPHRLNKILFQDITHLIANSSFVMGQLRRDFTEYLPEKQYVIPNGISLNGQMSEVDYTTSRIAVLGRLSWEKGVDLAIEAFARIHKTLPASRLVIIGEGDERETLKKLCDHLGIREHVEFAGFQEDFRSILSECSILMIPSRWEGFSYAKLEAMRLKIPIVAFELESLKENIVSGSVIKFAKPFNVEQLANQVIDLVNAPERAKEVGENGFDHACRFYDMEKTIGEFEKLLVD